MEREMKTVKSDLRPDFITDEMLNYLDDLRVSGETNMFGSGRYVCRSFKVNSHTAKEIIMYWMKTFGNVRR
jgi:hypothetical protein